jgi:ubiquinone/menaquinone biosynthesis C-methylase UbiE
VTRHAVFPEGNHDEAARFSFLAQLNHCIQTKVFPGNRAAWEKRVRPRFLAEQGREPTDRQEIAPYMERDLHYQTWSSLRRNLMEMRHENGRALVLRQLADLNARARALNAQSPRLELDPELGMPSYLTARDIHCMPGGYHTELQADDISAAANYDAGTYVVTAGMLGPLNDGAGRSIVAWFREHQPQFSPRRILDIGCGMGLNALPLAKAFPQAEVIALDAAAPLLRYGHARAVSLGVNNVRFVQQDAEQLAFPEASFDLVTTAMFWHETSAEALPRILAEVRRVLAPAGLHLSLEQPTYRGMPAYDAFIRDWDGANNNEPFWGALHEMNMVDEMVRAGFERERCFETEFVGQLAPELASESGMDQGRDFGRGGTWYGFGAWA